MVTMKDIPTIRDNLKKCKPADLANNSDKPLTNRETIRQLAPTLLKMRERGFTTGTLAELLQEHKITIKGRDLSRYLREYTSPAAKLPVEPVEPDEDKASLASMSSTGNEGH